MAEVTVLRDIDVHGHVDLAKRVEAREFPGQKLKVLRRGERVADLGGVGRARALDRIRHQDDRGIDGRADVLAGIASLDLKIGEIGLEIGAVAIAIEATDDMDTLDRGPRDVDELPRVERLGADDRGGNPRRAQLGDQRRASKEIAGDVDRLRRVALDARDDRAELPVARGIGLCAKDLETELAGDGLEALERRLAVIVVHRDDGNRRQPSVSPMNFAAARPRGWPRCTARKQ
jgi:hypothetical protein